MDFKWMSNGGLLLDANGDIATSTPMESIQDMVRSRLKARFRGWKLYNIGADLEAFLGQAIDAELEVSIKRQVLSVLVPGVVPAGMLTVTTIPAGTTIKVLVYLQGTLISSVTLNRDGSLVEVR